MASSKPNKQKVTEVRHFNDQWRQDFVCCPTPGSEEKSVCLICNAVIPGFRKHNLQRHHDTNHKDYDTKFLLIKKHNE